MRKLRIQDLSIAVALCILLSLPFTAWASLSSGTATDLSGTRNISYTTQTTSKIRWSMQRTFLRLPPGETVISSSGTFTDAGNTVVLGTINKALSKSKPISPSDSFNFTETILIPRDVLFKAYKQNIRTLYYRRNFTDCPATECSQITIAATFTLTGSPAGVFNVTSYSLRFRDASLTPIIEQDQTLQAEARIQVTGTGTIRGVWEVASPGSTAGRPLYQTIQLVVRQLSSGQDTPILSPPLPARQPGNHLVRFRFLAPELREEPPVLQYVVRAIPAIPTITLTSPRDGATANQDTRFQWETVRHANGYKIELLDRKPQENSYPTTPAAGILLRSDVNSTNLPGSLMERLEPGQRYWWHVLALDDGGSIIAASDWNSVTISK
jgi:hypothetical protein